MSLGKRAKILDIEQDAAALAAIPVSGRYPERNLVMYLLSTKAGFRAVEIANVTWAMVLDASGQIGNFIALENIASKGSKGGRAVSIHPDLRDALVALWAADGGTPAPESRVIRSERGRRGRTGGEMTAKAVAEWFSDFYRQLGFIGCTSHSGRRTFITRLARSIGAAGGSLKDVQSLAGHQNLSTTQIYIEENSEAQRRAIEAL